MTPISRASIVALGLIVLAAQVKGARKVTIDAGVRFIQDYLLLLAGDEIVLVRNYQETELGTKTDMSIPQALQVQAAFSLGAAGQGNVNYYGPDFGIRLNFQTRKSRRLAYGPARRFLRNGGPDAAARMNDKVYFFKGCDMIRRSAWNRWEDQQNVADIGLPCHIDAAWNFGDDENQVVVLKGDQIWLWSEDGAVEGPKDFTSMYTLTSWELIPSNEK